VAIGLTVADAFLRLHVDGATLRRDVARDVEQGATPAGARFGKLFRASAITALAGIGAAIGIGVIAADQATKFQAAMKRIQTQAGATAKDVGVLSEQVLHLASTRAQQGPQELAAALYHLKSVGLDNVNAMKALRTASDLAAVGGADLESTTNALAGAWRTGIRGATNFGQAAATVNAIIGAGNMTLSDFVSAIGTGILPAAKTWGLGLSQVGSALALMTDEGQNAAEAATRLRMTFALLGAPSATAAKQLAQIGITGLQLGQAMRSPGGLIAAVQLLKDHLDKSGLSATQAAALLARAFGGGRSSATILGLINNLDVLKKKQDQVNSSMGKYGAAVAAQRATAEAQFHRLLAILQVGMIRLGNIILPVLTSIAGWFVNTGVPAVMTFWDAFVSPAATRAIAVLRTAVSILTSGHLPTTARSAAQPSSAAMRFSPGRVIPAISPAITGALRQSPGRTAAQILPPVTAQASGWERVLQTIHGWLVAIGGYVAHTLWPWWSKIWAGPVGQFIRAQLAPALRDVWSFLRQVWAATVAVWKAWAPILGPALKAFLIFLAVNLATAAAGLRLIAWVLAHVVGPAFTIFGKLSGNIVANLRGSWRNLTSWLGTAWRIAMRILRVALADLLGFILGAFAAILHGAARAFGWIPGIGGQLRKAAGQFDTFRRNVTNSILGIKDHTVTVGVAFRAAQSGRGQGPALAKPRVAQGGKMRGPGGPTGDQIPAWLSDQEWVVRASSSRLYGDEAMQAVNEGRAFIAYAGGGRRGLSVRTALPSARAINAGVLAGLNNMAQSNALGILAALGMVGGPGGGGAPGGATHAAIPYLESLWVAAGGPRSLAHLMAAIAMAESGGNARAFNPSGASGLWQILGAVNPADQPFLFNPMVNAREAVLKWRTQGLGAWVTYTSGAYRAYYNRGGRVRAFGDGGWLTEPVRGVGMRSGAPYAFAERGQPEYVGGGPMGGDAMGRLLGKLDRLIKAVEAAPQRTAGGMAEALNRAGRRSAYSAAYGG